MNLQNPQKLLNSYKIIENLFSALIVLSICLCGVQSYCVSIYDKLQQEAIFVNLTNDTIYKKWMRPHSTYSFQNNAILVQP